jgi:hypothetical protein
MQPLPLALTVSTLALWTACSGRADYSDAPDLDAARAAFHCDRPGDPREERACTGLERFEAATDEVELPSAGRRVYLGRLDCSTPTSDSVVFSLIQLRAEPAPTRAVDASHRLEGSVAKTMLSFAGGPEIERAAARTLGALRERAEALEMPPELAGGRLPAEWSGWLAAARADATPVVDAARSDGPSLLLGPGRVPAWWDDAESSPPYAYLRQSGDELIYVRPPSGDGPLGHQACVHHTYLVPGQ